MTPTSAHIEIRNLFIQFGKQQVLRDISLTIPRGQTLAILGESGCGKTVLMKTILGLIKPTNGQIAFDSQTLEGLNERQMTRLRTRFGYVFQNAALFDSMTVEQNVTFPLRHHRTVPRVDRGPVARARLNEVGLPENVLNKKPAELSGGMRKRVGLARALVMNPEVLLYDEPTTGLDPIMSDVINQLMLRTSRRNHVTSVVVTHDMTSARKVADRIVMLYPLSRLDPDEPQILFDGTPEEIDESLDRRVTQFVRGEAGDRLHEIQVDSEEQDADAEEEVTP